MLSTRIIQTSKRIPYGSQEYTSPGGSFIFTVPADVTEIRMTVVGGGGWGGTGNSGASTGGGGAGAGGCNIGTVATTPGENLEVTVGVGGYQAIFLSASLSRVSRPTGTSFTIDGNPGTNGFDGDIGGGGGFGGGGAISGPVSIITTTTGGNGSNASGSTGGNGGGRTGSPAATGGAGTITTPIAGSGPGYGASGGGTSGGDSYEGGIGGDGYVLIEWGY